MEAGVALLEFVDGRGVEWRAWNITTDDMHPVTAREMFVGTAADFQEGWLVFESAGERRRLTGYPSNWSSLSPAGLEALLARATRVVSHTSHVAANVVAPPASPAPRADAESTTSEFRRYEDASASAPHEPPHPQRRADDRADRRADDQADHRTDHRAR
jgi:hypothetical protein